MNQQELEECYFRVFERNRKLYSAARDCRRMAEKAREQKRTEQERILISYAEKAEQFAENNIDYVMSFVDLSIKNEK